MSDGDGLTSGGGSIGYCAGLGDHSGDGGWGWADSHVGAWRGDSESGGAWADSGRDGGVGCGDGQASGGDWNTRSVNNAPGLCAWAAFGDGGSLILHAKC